MKGTDGIKIVGERFGDSGRIRNKIKANDTVDQIKKRTLFSTNEAYEPTFINLVKTSGSRPYGKLEVTQNGLDDFERRR